MKQDFELLKQSTEVIYKGIRTKIESNRILRPSWAYEGTDEEAEATLRNFYDSMGTHFYELDVERMTSDMIEWKFDYVRIDTSDIPLYLRDLNEIVNLTDIDLPHSLSDLSRDELIALRRQIQIGSMYLSDFNNDYFIDRDELCAESESFLDSQMEKYGADEYESHLTPEEFADHFFQA